VFLNINAVVNATVLVVVF